MDKDKKRAVFSVKLGWLVFAIIVFVATAVDLYNGNSIGDPVLRSFILISFFVTLWKLDVQSMENFRAVWLLILISVPPVIIISFVLGNEDLADFCMRVFIAALYSSLSLKQSE